MVSRRSWMWAALAVIAATLGACSRPAPVKGTFVLEPAAPPVVARTHSGSVRVGTATVGAAFRGKQFVFRESELKFETDYYNEFLVSPAANIGEATTRALAAAKVFSVVVPAGTALEPDWVLDVFVESLYGDGRTLDKPSAVLAMTFFLRKGDGAVPVWSKSYGKRVPFTTGSAASYIAAQNTALGDILAELARDLSGLALPPRN
ncbi:MAG: ABC-type transport auxiliary lipoprotein family protein [Burkholderiales bacterium]